MQTLSELSARKRTDGEKGGKTCKHYQSYAQGNGQTEKRAGKHATMHQYKSAGKRSREWENVQTRVKVKRE